MEENQESLSVFKSIIYDYFGIRQIFTLEEIPKEIITNKKSPDEVDKREIKLIMESIDLIALYNKDFSALRNNFFFIENPKEINLIQFQKFIKNYNDGYYYRKAIFSIVNRIFLFLACFLILIYFLYPKYKCTDEPFEEQDKNYWILDDEKYKVKLIYTDFLYYLRILDFIINFSMIFFEIYILYYLRRIKANKYYIIIYQLIRFILFGIILNLEIDERSCYESPNDENHFYKSNRFDIKRFLLTLATFRLFYL